MTEVKGVRNVCTVGPEHILLTAAEVAALIKVSVPTLVDWYDQPGRGPAPVFVGERMLFRLTAVRDWIDTLPSTPAPLDARQ